MNAPETRTYIDTVARLKGNAYAAVRVQVDVDTVDGMLRADARVVEVKSLAEPMTREELDVEFLRGQLAEAEDRLERASPDGPTGEKGPGPGPVGVPVTKVRPLVGTDKMIMTLYETDGVPAEVLVHPGQRQADDLIEEGAIGLTREFVEAHFRFLEVERRTYEHGVREKVRPRDDRVAADIARRQTQARTAMLRMMMEAS